MTDLTSGSEVCKGLAASAGQLLRQAREGKGLSLSDLAASMHVPVHRLQALEEDRWDDLPDVAFTRALAMKICRTLDIDVKPVVEVLPAVQVLRIEQLSAGLNEPFRERGNLFGSRSPVWLTHPMTLLAGLVFGAAALLQQMPQAGGPIAAYPKVSRDSDGPGFVVESAMGAPSTSSAATDLPTNGASEPTTSSPPVPEAAVDPLGELLMTLEAKEFQAAHPLELRVRAPSWIEVHDANGKMVFGRLLRPGHEPIAVGGVEPLRVKIGNADATEVKYRGRVVDLASVTRDNVARLDLN